MSTAERDISEYGLALEADSAAMAAALDARVGDAVNALARVGAPTLQQLPPFPLALKRITDVVLALVTMVLLAPLMLVLAVIIKVTSPGPALFRQQRVGRDGTTFTLLKFRTMRDGTHDEVLGSDEERRRYVENDFKLPADDPRITPVGRFLRKTSLDELPQLINVLLGQMSIVGNRPLLDVELGRRSEYDRRCYELLKPGMTGLWQVTGRSKVAHESRFELDRQYAEEWSLWLDIKILLRTPIAVLRVHHAH